MRRSHTPRLVAAVAAALTFVALPAAAGPVYCGATAAATDLPGVRVFPEPIDSTSFLKLAEFECGMDLLESRYPTLIEMNSLGKGSDGVHDHWDVVMTDETVPAAGKRHLLVINSIHGNEIGGREGAARNIEDLVDPDYLGDEPWVQQVLDEFIIHFTFSNPDGWFNGDGAGTFTRGNDTGRDLNRNQPVQGWISPANGPLDQPESRQLNDLLLENAGDWYLGTDNHGQGQDTYAAAGLQIVGQFDYQKSETLARFADAIGPAMGEYNALNALQALNENTGEDIGAYHWGTLYDMLGYSASGSVIDYYNTPGLAEGTGFATELTVSQQQNTQAYPAELNQVWVDSIRAINYTMFKQAIDPVDYAFTVGGRSAYLFDPDRIRHDDANGVGFAGAAADQVKWPQQPYDVSRMKFFEDLNGDADRPLTSVSIDEIAEGTFPLDQYDSLVVANDIVPEELADEDGYFELLRAWVADGGNLILTDAALPALPQLDDDLDDAVELEASDIFMSKHYVGSVSSFVDRNHALNAGLRGVASQTYDTVPIGYRFGANASSTSNSAPNWKVNRAAWEAAGGYTAGLNGTGNTIYGELPVGDGRIRILGALLPDPTEEFYHPFGLQNYAVTYTGYTLLQNMLVWDNPARVIPPVVTGATACVPIGGTLDITGTGFGATKGSSGAVLSGAAIPTSSWSDTAVAATVPAGATSGYAGVVKSGIVSNGRFVRVVQTDPPAGPAVVEGMSPASGPAGTQVTFTGSGFGSEPACGEWVTFGGMSGSIVSWSDTQVKAIVPAGAPDGYAGIVVNDVASNGRYFNVSGAAAPQVDAVTPAEAASGETLTVTGSGFGAAPDADTYAVFAGQPVTAETWSPTEVTIEVPDGASSGYVGVVRDGQSSNGKFVRVAGNPAPVLDAIDPTSGPVGTRVVLTGSGFGTGGGSDRVVFSGVTAPVVSWTATRIVADVPAGATTGYAGVVVGGETSNGKPFTVTP